MLPFFDLSLKINGYPIQKAKADLKKIRSFSSQEYEIFLGNRKEDLLQFHSQNNPLYKELLGDRTFLSWEELPVLTKKDLQRPLAERLSKGFTKKNVFVNQTSGSSGNPFIFAKDPYCHALVWASNMMRFGWHGVDFNKSFQARFYGISLNFIKNKKERIKDFLASRYRFPIFDLSNPVLESFIKTFKTKKFDYINGYTSCIVLFARYLETKNIVLKTICPSLKVCVTTSEMLFDDDKIFLEKQLGMPIINEYGASELDLIAFNNSEGEWQVNSETLFVEILDENNNVLPHGKEGRIVVTSLFNKAFPMIRYETGDLGVLDEKSTPQKTIMKKLIGRTNSFAILPSGKKAPAMTFYCVTKSVVSENGNIKEFLIVQTKIDTFEVNYVSDKELDSKQINQIKSALDKYLEPNLNFTFNRQETLKRSKSGKLLQFQSML